jgi:hypothetical protein
MFKHNTLHHYIAGPTTDLWADESAAAAANDADWTNHSSGNELLRIAQQQKLQQQQAAAKRSSGSSSKRKRPAPAPIAAVEIDMPGCSFNPEYEAHQDALAVAVAREYKQQLKEELAPKAPSLFAPAGGCGHLWTHNVYCLASPLRPRIIWGAQLLDYIHKS